MHAHVARSARTVTLIVVVALAITLACSTDKSTAPPPPAPGRIEVASGDAQVGEPGSPLRRDIVVNVVDSAGVPERGLTLEWVAKDGGVIEPSVVTTDDNGRAAVRWTLGPLDSHEAVATGEGVEPVTVTATGPLPVTPLGEFKMLQLETYEGSNQTVHPDFATADSAWPAPRRYLAITPYPNSDARFENPSIYESPRSVRWFVPPEGANPVDLSGAGYLSDPDIVFDPDTREFLLYYREVTAENIVWMMRSSDAVHWNLPTLAARAYNHELVSPSVVRRGANEWLMWAVNANLGCEAISTTVDVRRSSDGVHWSQPQATNMSVAGLFAWHVEVQWMADLGEYWALFNKKEPGSCTTPALYLATSRDGVEWKTYPTPVLAAGAIPEFQDIVYRSTFTYNTTNGVITFWYSGARYDYTTQEYVWKSVMQRRLRSDVLASASEPVAPSIRRRRPVPPLMIAP